MLPMQRITRLPLLIDAIFTRLDSNSSEFEVCREALEIINKVCTVVEIYTRSIPHKKHRIRNGKWTCGHVFLMWDLCQ